MSRPSDNHTSDAVVVGAGLNGAWAAKEFAEAGWRVELLDAGHLLQASDLDPSSNRHSPFDVRHHLFRVALLLRGNREAAFNKNADRLTARLYLDRKRSPYTTPPDADFSWHRVRTVGGRGHLWGRVMLRFTDDQLNRPGREWPITATELGPFYDHVESLLELGGAPSGHDHVPDGNYRHRRVLSDLERLLCDASAARWPGAHAVVNHVAEYQPSPLSPQLRAAIRTGNLVTRQNCVATSLHHDRDGRVDGVVVTDLVTGTTSVRRARHVVLAASPFETVRLLHASVHAAHPHGTGNSRGLLGTRALEHIMASTLASLPAAQRNPEPNYRHHPFFLNEPPHGFYLPSQLGEDDLGFGIQGVISRDTGLFYLGAFGETEPLDTNRVSIDPNRRDAHGVPVAAIDYRWSERDISVFHRSHAMLEEMVELFEERAGFRLDRPLTSRLYERIAPAVPVPGSNHECGGARMGNDPSSSVTDPYGRLWDAPNVTIADAAVFPSIPNQNPTLTSMALAVRAVRHVVAEAGGAGLTAPSCESSPERSGR